MAYKLVSHVICQQRFFVHKINDISFRERMFCILNIEQPFELRLRYKEFNKSIEFAPILPIGIQVQDTINFEKEYIFRLSTAEECQQHIDEIRKKKELIDEMIVGFTEDMMLEHNRKNAEKNAKN